MTTVTKNHSTQITHRHIWVLAGPMIISNISVPLVGAVDTAVVGHLPELHHIGAVALGALVFSFLYWGFGFLKMGITGFIARAYGINDQQTISETLLRFLLLSVVFGIVVILLRHPLISFAMTCLDSSANVERIATQYALIRIWSAPATLCVYVFTGIFVGLHNTRLALVLQLVLNLTNIALDLLFVPVMHWGVAGVAWATLIAEYSAALVGFYLLRTHLFNATKRVSRAQLLDASALKQIMQTNGNIFIRTMCLVFSFAFFTAQSAKQGELILAVNTVLLHLQSIMAYGLDGFAHAAEALGGSAYGAGDKTNFKRAVNKTTIWSGLTALMVCAIYLVFGNTIISWFSDNPEVLSLSNNYMIWMIITPIISCWSFQLDGLFIGTGHAREMRNAMVVSTLCYLAVAYFLQSFWGNHGLFLALSCYMIFRAITLMFYYPDILRSIENK